jgi:uncharacterized delta-60 repeat protein
VTITDDGSPLVETSVVNVTINVNDIVEPGTLTEVANFGRTAFGSLELTGLKTQAQLTDSITVAGVVYFLGTIDNVDKDVYMTAYNQDGTLNLAFGNSGIKVFDFGYHEYGKAIIHDTNSFYIAFDRDDGTYTEACFLKIDNTGAFKTAFGDNGLSCTTEQKIFSINDLMYDDFDILAVGKVQGTDADTLVIQIDEDTGVFFDHTIDPTTTHLIQDVSGLGLDDEAKAVYRPNNWDIMITGNVDTAGGDSDIFAWQIDSAGDPVTSFNNDGSPKFYDVSGSNDQVLAIGGKSANNFTAILAGSTVLGSGAKEALLLAIDKTGALVTSFDTDGIATYDVDGDAGAGTGYAEFTGIAEVTGVLYVSGTLYDGEVDFQNKPFTTRISKADGSVDGTYGVSGYQKIAYASDNAFALSMNLDNAQTMWLTGYVESGSKKNMAISTVDSTGALFTGNNIVDGKLTLTHSSTPSDDTVAQVIQIQNGVQVGKYLTASTADDATNKHIILTRLTSAGALDTSFDSDGHKRLKIGTSASVNGMFELTTGNFIVYGNVTEGAQTDGFIARIDQNGLLDTSFATNGIYNTSNTALLSTATNIAFNQVKADSLGRFIAVGNKDGSAFVLRLTAAGVIDAAFNNLDTAGYEIGAVTDDYMAVVIDGSDAIYAAGNRDSGGKDMLLVKYLATGLIDTTLNGSGELTIEIAGFDDSVEQLMFDSNNDLYLVGNDLDTPNQVAVVKTSTLGVLDNSFSGDGKASFILTLLSGNSGVTDVAIDTNDNIVVAGFGEFFGVKKHMLGRIKPDGTLDSSFDGNAYFLAFTCTGAAQIESIILLNNSSFIVAGQCYKDATDKNNIDISHYQLN